MTYTDYTDAREILSRFGSAYSIHKQFEKTAAAGMNAVSYLESMGLFEKSAECRTNKSDKNNIVDKVSTKLF